VLSRMSGSAGHSGEQHSPTEVNTTMALNEEVYHLYRPDLEKPGIEEFKEVAQMTKLLRRRGSNRLTSLPRCSSHLG